MHLLKNSKYLNIIREGICTNKKKLPVRKCISHRYKIKLVTTVQNSLWLVLKKTIFLLLHDTLWAL